MKQQKSMNKYARLTESMLTLVNWHSPWNAAFVPETIYITKIMHLLSTKCLIILSFFKRFYYTLCCRLYKRYRRRKPTMFTLLDKRQTGVDLTVPTNMAAARSCGKRKYTKCHESERIEHSLCMCKKETGDRSWQFELLDKDNDMKFDWCVNEQENRLTKRFLGWSCLDFRVDETRRWQQKGTSQD